MIDADAVTLSEISLYSPHKDGGSPERIRPYNEGSFNLNHAHKVQSKWQ